MRSTELDREMLTIFSFGYFCSTFLNFLDHFITLHDIM